MYTTTQYNIQLDGKSGSPNKKFDCYNCGRKKTFRKYYNYITNEYISDTCGKCDRGNKCDYHLSPKEYYSQNPDRRPKLIERIKLNKEIAILSKPPVHLNPEILKGTLNDYEKNSFIQPLLRLFKVEQIEYAISEYYIGTKRANFKDENESCLPCVFWFIDYHSNIRAGQVKLFDRDCHTAKYYNEEGKKKYYQTWIHSLIKKHFRYQLKDIPEWLENYIEGEKVTCLYGEHLLSKYPDKPVALVEAPKTAIIASICYPRYIWLATASLTYLTRKRCKVLKGRRVVLFPDCGIPNPHTGKTCLMQWKDRVDEFKEIANFEFSTLLEEHATQQERVHGIDLADIILREYTKAPIEFSSNNIEFIDLPTQTGFLYGNLMIVSMRTKENRYFKVIYSKDGELITTHDKLYSLSLFYELTLQSGKLDGIDCLFHILTTHRNN